MVELSSSRRVGFGLGRMAEYKFGGSFFVGFRGCCYFEYRPFSRAGPGCSSVSSFQLQQLLIGVHGFSISRFSGRQPYHGLPPTGKEGRKKTR